MIRATLFYRGDEEPDDVREILGSLQEEIPHELLEIDVSSDISLREKYADHLPVIEVGYPSQSGELLRGKHGKNNFTTSSG